jgi:S-adenosylmethionine decarboxylase
MDGLHLLADLHGCRPRHSGLMTKPAILQAFCLAAVSESGLHAVAQLFHSFGSADAAGLALEKLASLHQTAPLFGITGVVLLAESHCAIHTWPEKDAVTIDVYVCNYGQDNSDKARTLMARLVEGFGSLQVKRQEIVRGS